MLQVRVTWGTALMATWITAMVYATIADWVRRTNRRSTVAVRRVANTICESWVMAPSPVACSLIERAIICMISVSLGDRQSLYSLLRHLRREGPGAGLIYYLINDVHQEG